MKHKVKNIKSNPAKHFIKRSIQHIAARFGRHTRTYREPQLLTLMYHRILPLEDERAKNEEPGMIVSPETFELHLSILKDYFDIIALSDWVQLKRDGKTLPNNACVITFDDGWADNYEFAFPILQKMNIPVTIFLVSDMIGTNEIFWPERLTRLVTTIACHYPQHWSHPELAWLQLDASNYVFSQTSPDSEEISALIALAKNYSDQEIHERISHTETVLQLDTTNRLPSLLNWQQVKEMTDSNLIEFGSHTCNHVRLNEQISNNLIEHEIVSSKKTIEKHTSQTINTFCFPNGDYSPLALEQVKLNYTAAVTTKTGWNTASSDPYLLQRIGVHQDNSQDKTAFLARISGWM